MDNKRYIVRRAAQAWDVIDTTTGESVATFDVFNRRLAEMDAAARNREG